MKLFESHAHYYLYELSPLTEAEIFKEEFDDLNVDKCCFLSIPQQYDSLGNKKFDLLHNLRGIYLKKYFYPNGYCYAGLVHPDKYDDLVSIQNDFYEQVKRFYMMGYDGVKMLEGYPTFIKYTKQGLNSPIYDKFYDFCEKNHFPITMHIANPDENWDINTASKEAIAQGRIYDDSYPSKETITSQMFDVLNKFPNLHLTLAHFGFFSCHYDDANKFMSYPNTKLDTTPGGEQFINISKNWEKWKSFFNKYQNRIIYGSDLYPFLKNELWKIAYHRRPDFLRQLFETDNIHQYLDEEFKGIKIDKNILDKIYHLNADKYLGSPKPINNKLVLEEIKHIEKMDLNDKQKNDLQIIKNAFMDE